MNAESTTLTRQTRRERGRRATGPKRNGGAGCDELIRNQKKKNAFARFALAINGRGVSSAPSQASGVDPCSAAAEHHYKQDAVGEYAV